MSELLPVRATFTSGPPSNEIPDTDLALINATTSQPFEAKDIAVFACVMATQELTDFATRLGTSSLVNFAAAASAGTPYLLDHDPEGGIYGYTYAGQYDAGANEARAAVFLPRGRRPSGPKNKSSDQEIADIQSGLRRAVSVGFGGPLTEWTCDLCGKDVFSLDCSHLPGMKFDGKLATATVNNARLVELSGVFNGACPGAVIGKSQEMYAASRFGLKQYRGWLDQMRVPDPAKFTSVTIGGNSPRLGDNSAQEKPMKHLLAGALAALGMHTLAGKVSGVQGDGDGNADPQALANLLASETKAEVDAQVKGQLAAHPLLAPLAAAGIESSAQIAGLLAAARAGESVVSQKREAAKKNAVIAYGAESGALEAETIDALPAGAALDRYAARLEADALKVAPAGGQAAQTAAQPVPTIPVANAQDAGAANTAAQQEAAAHRRLAATSLGRAALAAKKNS